MRRVIIHFGCALIIVRDELLLVQPEDISDDNALLAKSSYFYSLFTNLQAIQNVKITDTRKKKLAEKRHEKRKRPQPKMLPLTSGVAAVWVGPPAPPQTDEEVRRVASISDPSQSSAGSQLFQACQEPESEAVANLFCTIVLKRLFRKDPPVDWVTGRPELPVLQWRSR
jgi:hypothetical protein